MLPIQRTRKKDTDIQPVQSKSLSDEQELFIKYALEGKNILVDACIGSGKTTSIQELCNRMPGDTRILYLTYNKLLKLDAKKKIDNANVLVTNYHGYASYILAKYRVSCGVADSIQEVVKGKYVIPYYDVLIIDEYQDIEVELAELLEKIKRSNPKIQIIAVGDMEQKIYDKTTLNVPSFMESFLGEHINISFTKCFRLSEDIAAMLGRIWEKKIDGINNECEVEYMTLNEAGEFLAEQDPRDILCLGARTGDMTTVLNRLETKYPETFNKKTVYASIRTAAGTGTTSPTSNSAIFTTFDSSKGLERPVCVVFDWTLTYWYSRVKRPGVSAEIMRNIFCVAASRGKKKIIFVASDKGKLLAETDLMVKKNGKAYEGLLGIDEMFDFRYKEDIEYAYGRLRIRKEDNENMDGENIYMKDHDELIDLSPCINIYQKAAYFKKYNIDDEISQYFEINKDRAKKDVDSMSMEEKILYLVSVQTNQTRYVKQVTLPLVDSYDRELLFNRLGTRFRRCENVQIYSKIPFANKEGKIEFTAVGYADLIKKKEVYSLIYSKETSHTDYLICACYMIANGLEKGHVWNVQTNEIFEIKIPDKRKFMDAVAVAVTKGQMRDYVYPIEQSDNKD